jgi:hypothetical protein
LISASANDDDDYECVELLLEANAATEAKSHEGETVLMFAACNANIESMKLLLDAGADSGAKDNEDNVPLFYAVQGANVECIALLPDCVKVVSGIVPLVGNTMAAFAQALKTNTSVTSVDVTGVYIAEKLIDNEAMCVLAEAFKVNKTIKTIDLSGNTMGDPGVEALANALAMHPSIRGVSLNGNNIGDDGASALIEMLRVNTLITTLSLEENAVSASKRATIDELLARNDRLRHFFFFETRQLLKSLICDDELGVLWSYFVENDDDNYGHKTPTPAVLEITRAEFSGVVALRANRFDDSDRGQRAAARELRRRQAADADTDDVDVSYGRVTRSMKRKRK